MEQKYLAVEVDELLVRMGILTGDGAFLCRKDFPTRREWSGTYILSDIQAAAHQMMMEQGLSTEAVGGACIALPGRVSEEGILAGSDCLGWGVLDVAGILGRLLQLPVKAVQKIHASVAGEHWLGAGKSEDNIVLISLGPVVESGILLNGDVFTGADGNAGMLCHLCVKPGSALDFGHDFATGSYSAPELQGSRSCRRGGNGCLGQYVSDAGIERMAAKEFHLDLTAKEVFAQAAEKDEKAVRVVKRISHYLGLACAQAACVLNPELFILRGNFARIEQAFLNDVQKQYRRYVFHEAQDCKFCTAQLGRDAALYGCGAIARKAGLQGRGEGI